IQPTCITLDVYRRRRKSQRQRVLTSLNERLDCPRRLTDDGREIDGFASDLEQPTTDARDIQKVIDDPQQFVTLGIDGVEQFGERRLRITESRQVNRMHDWRERVA